MENLINQLNGFDFNYERIDDYKLYCEWRDWKNHLNQEVKQLSETDKEKLNQLLTEQAKKYFL